MTSEKSTCPVFKKDQPDDSYKFQPLPEPTGHYPYHLLLNEIIPEVNPKKMVFHMVGDTGSLRNQSFQQSVSGAMASKYQNTETAADKPLFLYHLGDIVYNHGEAEQYDAQFFNPYRLYPGEIFAIAGNHDSDVNPESAIPYQSLDAFTTVFCDTERQKIVFSSDKRRKSMVQPNVYWTLETSLANIIGLHSNVPKYGVITAEQRAWLIAELQNADAERPGKALILCVHHAPYSADVNHGSSRPMIELLEGVFTETGIRPDVVFSGHVHNYQRFTRLNPDGTTTPYIVAGCGGYDELHAVVNVDDERFTADDLLLNGIKLEAYGDEQHGFLKIILENTRKGVTLTGEYYALPNEVRTGANLPAVMADKFIINTW